MRRPLLIITLLLACAGVAVISESHETKPSPLASPAPREATPEEVTTLPPTTALRTTTTHTSRSQTTRAQRRSNATIEACIRARENPHDPSGSPYGRSTNPNHFGFAQWDLQTWIAHGGKKSDWGHASPAEQERVFRSGVSQYGYGAWTPYDGCG